MGQYYIAVFLDNNNNIKGCIRSWTYDCGSKLGEHAYHKNPFVTAVELELGPGGRFHKSRVVWAGDYADNEPGSPYNLHAKCENMDDVPVSLFPQPSLRFLVNHSKKLVVDMQLTPGRYHPLPLLTADGNGRGGGDVEAMPFIGAWARDVLSLESDPPKDFFKFAVCF